MTKTNHRIGFTLLAMVMLPHLPVMAAEGPPDLTKGETTGVNRKATYNLGSTGMRGWIYLKPATHFDGLQGRTTAVSRQILVTHVGAKNNIFPVGCNQQRVDSMEAAIKSIEAATTQPELRSIKKECEPQRK